MFIYKIIKTCEPRTMQYLLFTIVLSFIIYHFIKNKLEKKCFYSKINKNSQILKMWT